MTTAIIGVGKIGTTVARHLVNGGERVILASHGAGQAEAMAKELGKNARAATVEQAINDADVVVFAVWFDTIKELISQHARLLEGKVVVDPSNPIKAGDGGKFVRTLPDGVSGGAEIAKRLPKGAHYVKALGTLGADSLASSSNRTPSRAALYYATDDRRAATAIERLITAAGFDAVKAGGVDASLRIEMFGDLHQYGGLNGKVPDRAEAVAALARKKGA
ncbi:MAG: NADPH-dependent F420 reductase [Solirubrobacteraceae bacterium]